MGDITRNNSSEESRLDSGTSCGYRISQGGNVVLGLIGHAELAQGTRLYFDNLFTSLGLLAELCKRGIGATGTLRENRISQHMSLTPKNSFKKSKRGTSMTVSSDNMTAVRWNDNAVVTVLSNCATDEPFKTVQRYSRPKEKESMFKCLIQ
ncbi:Transposase IS4 [Popillia japonica]|uniref:Transposase IS4 n=1 Tax=Popillia japonica TaxID=7064 RepID=A0AAW1L8P0_POPJA